MFIEKDLVIENCYIGCPKMTGVKEEDLNIFAPRVLDDFNQYNYPVVLKALGISPDVNKMTRMMAVLPYIAEHFNLDKNDILKAWTAEFGLLRMRNGDDN